MAKVKFDAQKLKQLAIEKGEILGIAVCSLLTTLFLVICILAIFGASSEDQKIAKNAKDLALAIQNAEPPSDAPVDKGSEEKPRTVAAGPDTKWSPVSPTAFLTRTPLYDAGAAGDVKRRNPLILPIDVVDRSGNEKYLQVDFKQGGVKLYQFNAFKGQIAVAERVDDPKVVTPALSLRTERMVVVTATFPYKEQLALFMKALRIEKMEELFNQGLAPMLAGLNVYRGVYDPVTRKTTDWEPVYVIQEDGKIKVSDAVGRLLKEAVYDEVNVAQYGHIFFPTAVTPLPALGDGVWPPLKLDDKAAVVARDDGSTRTTGTEKPKSVFGKDFAKGAKTGEMPKDEGPALKASSRKARDLGRIYVDRLQGKINPFNPFGLYPDTPKDETKEEPKDNKTPDFTPLTPSGEQMKFFVPGARKQPDKKADPTAGKGTEESPYPALMAGVGGLTETGKTVVRFFDTGLQPGKQYQYSIQVRMLNPNFGKTKEVAFPGLALPKELLSQPVYTQPIAVPTAFHFYVVDQQPLASKTPRIPQKGNTAIDQDPRVPLNKAPVQIHQWVEEAGARGDEKKVCDWAIAERLFLGRGDPIGRKLVEVEVPMWDELRGAFSLGVLVKTGVVKVGTKFENRYTRKANVPIDFGEEENGPLVVDFTGGKTLYSVPPSSTLSDDGNLEMLILMPDGKLILRESRADSDEENRSGAERLRVYTIWAERLDHYRGTGLAVERPKGP